MCRRLASFRPLNLLMVFVGLVLSATSAEATTIGFDFEGPDPLSDLADQSGNASVAGGRLDPAPFGRTTNLVTRQRLPAGPGRTFRLSAEFGFDVSRIDPNPGEVTAITIGIDTPTSPTQSLVRGVGADNLTAIAYFSTADVVSRNERDHPRITLVDGAVYRLAYEIELIGGPFLNHSRHTTDLYRIDGGIDELVSTYTLDSFNHRLFSRTDFRGTLSLSSSGGATYLDNFSISSVPEPNTALLFGLGLAGLAARRCEPS